MINGSQAFNNAVDEGGYPYKARLSHEGTIIDCDISSCKIYKGSTGNDVFSIGSIYIPYIEIEAVELTIPVYGKELKLEVGVVINEEQTEWIKIGYFTVSKASSSTVNAKFTAVGRIAAVLPKVQVSVTSSMTPAELIQATQTAVRAAGYPDFIIDTTGVTLSTSPITDLSNTNAQQIIEILAGVVGAYATEDNNGNVVLFRYDTTNYIEYDGSRMTQHPVTNEEDFELINVKVIKTEEYEQDDGTVVPEVSFISGEPYEWVVMNSNMTAGLFPAYCQNCLGLSYRPATINFAYGDPRLEAKDVLQITDVDDTVYLVPCMTLVHDIAGGVTTEITAPHEGEGEIDSESEMGGKGPITQQIDAMGRNLMSAQVSAAQAKTAAASAKADAASAKADAASAKTSAASARTDAASAKADANTAKQQALSATSSANAALMGLSQVESVIDALNWIASHGTYTKATTYVEGTTYYTLTGVVEPSPYAERKYYVLSEGIYVQTDVGAIAVAEPVVGDLDTYYELLEDRYVLTEDTEIDPDKTYYTISDTYYITTGTPVAIPKPEDISLYYTLNVRDAIGDYVQTHLAVTNDGLYVMADKTQWKVLIANNGVYILDPSNRAANQMTASKSVIGYEGETRAEIDYHSMRLLDKDQDQPFVWLSDLRGEDGTAEISETSTEDSESGWYSYDLTLLYEPYSIVGISINEVAQDLSFYVTNYTLNDKNRPNYDVDITFNKPVEKTTTFKIVLSRNNGEYSTDEVSVVVQEGAQSCSATIYNDRGLGILRMKDDEDNNLLSVRKYSSKYYSISSNDFFDIPVSSISITYKSKDTNLKAFTFGYRNTESITGPLTFSHGENNEVGGHCSFASGYGCVTSGRYSHAEGYMTNAKGGAHAEGYKTTAQHSSHAEGEVTTSSGYGSHAEGSGCKALGNFSHAEGDSTTAKGTASHAGGVYTVAQSSTQTVIGDSNIIDYPIDGNRGPGEYVFIIGNGISSTARRNALAVTWNGEIRQGLTSLSLGTYVAAAVLTSSGGNLNFSIPTGRVFPPNTTIDKITFNIVARASNSNGAGYYIIKATSGGSGGTAFDSSTRKTFYNANNVQKTVTSSMWTTSIQGNTNIYISIAGGTDFFSGTSTIRGYINNNAAVVLLTDIQVTLSNPFAG